MKPNVKKAILAVIIVIIGYAGSYVSIRVTRADKSKDGKTYVVFPSNGLATLFRPMSAIDGAITGIQVRVGTEGEPIGDPDQE
jgi:hypothetical protein